MKSRTANHERTIREFTIASTGVVVGQPLTGFRGVLGGSPVWEGPAAALADSASPLP